MRRRLPAAAFALALLAIPMAQADPQDPTRDTPLADPAQEARARVLMREIRCVVCQSQAIDESDAEIAAQLRNAIREQIAAGKSEAEIRDFLVARYGDFVLFKPPFKASTLLLWIGPFALAATGIGFVLLRRRAAPAGTGVDGAGPVGAGLAPAELSESERARVRRLLAEGEDVPPAPSSTTGAS
jgi:cytochrome c-type biogenesis protein CcmH